MIDKIIDGCMAAALALGVVILGMLTCVMGIQLAGLFH
jgi:hypothetical protein